MNRILLVASLFFCIALNGCVSQKDTLIYRGGNGKPSDREHALFYQEVHQISEEKYRISEFQKEDEQWHAGTIEKVKVSNDSTLQITRYYKTKRVSFFDRKLKRVENGLYRFKDCFRDGRLIQEGKTSSKFPLHLEGENRSYYSNGKISELALYKDNQLVKNLQWNRDGSKYLDNVFDQVDTLPEFPGGTRLLQSYIGIKTQYPEICQKNGITGKVFVEFVVMEDGSIEGIRLARGVDPYLDQAALDVVRSMKMKWKPGVLYGKNVRVGFTVPVNFKLR